MRKPSPESVRKRRAEACMNFMRKKKLAQEQLVLETTSIKDMRKP
jgi:hypothetical protein